MRSATRRLILAAILLGTCAGSDWPGFRGVDGTGVSDETNLPTSFGEQQNVAWRVPLPGSGPSGPIVVGGRVLLTAASGPRQDQLHVLAFDADSGELDWHRQLWATGSSLYNSFGGVAANTPASDSEAVYAFFSSGDLACFELDGDLRWFRGLGNDHPASRNDVGMASSPLVLGDTVIVQMECQGDSFAAGIDTATGETRWHVEREQDAVWCTPTVLRGRGEAKDLALLQSRSRLTALDPATGKLVWQFQTLCHTMASVTTADGVVYLPANGLNALKPTDGGVELLWHESRLRSQSASPIVHQGRAYVLNSAGILACGDVRDGNVLWQLRLKGPFWASGAVADGHLYAVNHKGLAHVVRLGDEEGELVAACQLEPDMLASPAVADGAIYFRSNGQLRKVAFK